MTNSMIEATDIVKILGDGAGRVEALKGVNLSLAGGELTLLMGPSGSDRPRLGRTGRTAAGQCRVCISIVSFVSDAYRRGKCSTGARCTR